MYLTDEIDEGATRRRLDEITSAGRRALEEHAERAAAIDAKFRQDQAKIDEEVKAMDQLVAESRAKQELEADKDEQPQNQWATRESKPTVHAFGGEEFTQSTPPPPPPMPSPPPVAPPAPPVELPPAPEPTPRSRLLSMGFEDDEPRPEPPAPPPPMARPAARRPEPVDDDDDLSDVNWMR